MKNYVATAIMAGAMAATPLASAADHADGSEVAAAPEADINDVYAWSSNGTVKLIMTVHPFADTTSQFSDGVQYVFHVGSAAMPLAAPAVSVNIICEFDASQTIQCWVSDGEGAAADYVTGDASNSSGISSMSGMTKVFAGPANDPFFFYLTGFNETRTTVIDFATNTLDPNNVDAGGCPDLSQYPGTAAALQGLLTGNGSPTNEFATLSVLAISMEVDVSLLTKGGQNVSVWASTRNKGG